MSTPLTDLASSIFKPSTAREKQKDRNAEMIMQLVDIAAKKDLYTLDIAKRELDNAVKDAEEQQRQLEEYQAKHKRLFKNYDYGLSKNEQGTENTTKAGKTESDSHLEKYEELTRLADDEARVKRDAVLNLIDDLGKAATLKESIKNLPYTAGKTKIEQETYGPEDFTAKILSSFSGVDSKLTQSWLDANQYLLDLTNRNTALEKTRTQKETHKAVLENRDLSIQTKKASQKQTLLDSVTGSEAILYYKNQAVASTDEYPGTSAKDSKNRTEFMRTQLSNFGLHGELSEGQNLAAMIMPHKQLRDILNYQDEVEEMGETDESIKAQAKFNRVFTLAKAQAFKKYVRAFGATKGEGNPKLITSFIKTLKDNLSSFKNDTDKENYIKLIHDNYSIDLNIADEYQTEKFKFSREKYIQGQVIQWIDDTFGGLYKKQKADYRGDPVFNLNEKHLKQLMEMFSKYYDPYQDAGSEYKDKREFVKKNIKYIREHYSNK